MDCLHHLGTVMRLEIFLSFRNAGKLFTKWGVGPLMVLFTGLIWMDLILELPRGAMLTPSVHIGTSFSSVNSLQFENICDGNHVLVTPSAHVYDDSRTFGEESWNFERGKGMSTF